jgi:hypothetical protein
MGQQTGGHSPAPAVRAPARDRSAASLPATRTGSEPDVAGLRDAGRLVTGLTGRELAREGLGPGTFGDLDAAIVVVGKTASHLVLGCMNDMAFAVVRAVDLAGGLADADIGAINQRLRHNVFSARGYQKTDRTLHAGIPGRSAVGAVRRGVR